MTKTPRPGPEDPRSVENAASYGGSGYRARTRSLQEECQAGMWKRCGMSCETDPLQEIALARPGRELLYKEPPNDWLMLERPDLGRIVAQHEAICEFYDARGVTVQVVEPKTLPLPNFIFLRDLFAATTEGIILGRPDAAQRAGEERYVLRGFVGIGLPILRSMHGTATFEGADLLWIAADQAIVGVGNRTNALAVEILTQTLSQIGVRLQAFNLPRGVQHLLGIVNFVDRELAVVDQPRAPRALRRWLQERGFRLIEFPEGEELFQKKSLNFVPLAPREVVMSAGCPRARSILERNGVGVHELDVSEYLKAAGGLGCLTGVIRRGAPAL